MFSSSGYFEQIDCPFLVSGLCERPYCHFKHSSDVIVNIAEKIIDDSIFYQCEDSVDEDQYTPVNVVQTALPTYSPAVTKVEISFSSSEASKREKHQPEIKSQSTSDVFRRIFDSDSSDDNIFVEVPAKKSKVCKPTSVIKRTKKDILKEELNEIEEAIFSGRMNNRRLSRKEILQLRGRFGVLQSQISQM